MHVKVMKKMGCCLLATLCWVGVSAQSAKQDRQYNQDAAAAREAVWNWDVAAFKKVDFESPSTSSAVMLAKHVDIKVSAHYNGSLGKGIRFIKTVRQMIRINDKAALDEYSQIDFQKYQKEALGRRWSAETMNYVGVRIIKPDHTIREVNAEDAVITSDNINDKKSKLAISDLQVGDVIDFFVQVQRLAEVGYPCDQQLFVICDDMPVQSYSVHCVIDNHFPVVYRAINGAPNFKQSRTDSDNVLDLLLHNIPAMPTSLWMSPMRQVPMLRMDVGLFGGDMQLNAGMVYTDIHDYLVRDAMLGHLSYVKRMKAAKSSHEYYAEIKDLVRNYEKKRGVKLTGDSLADYVYNAYRFCVCFRVKPGDDIVVGNYRNYHLPENNDFIFGLSLILDDFGIAYEYVMATSRLGPPQNMVMDENDYQFILHIKGSKPNQFASVETAFSNFTNIRSTLEDQTADAFGGNNNLDFKGSAIHNTVTIPLSTAEDNVKKEQYTINFEDNMQLLNIERNVTLTGHLRGLVQQDLMLFEDYYEVLRKNLGIENSLMDDFKDSRSNKSLADEYAAAFVKARAEVKDHFAADLETNMGSPIKALRKCQVDKMGLSLSDPAFAFTEGFTMDGWVKKAGNNYIVDAGKLLGVQLVIKPSQRERKVDVYMPCARTYISDATLQIPKGYSVEGVEQLNRSIDNESASFTVTATLDADVLKLHAVKVYKAAYEPAAKWKELLQVLDAANDFYGQKILLKKS